MNINGTNEPINGMFDIKKCENIECLICGSVTFETIHIVKKLPGLLIGSIDRFQTIPLSRCTECKHIVGKDDWITVKKI
jgi:hypothetical protein